MRQDNTEEYRSLEEQLKKGEFSSLYVLYGEEEYLKRQYENRLIAALSVPGDTMNVTVMKGKPDSEGAIIDLAETMPFLAERRLIILEDSGFCKNTSEKLAEYLENPAETTTFLFVESEVDKRNKLYKTIAGKGLTVNFARQSEATLYQWVSSRLKKEGKTMSQGVFRLFLEKTGDDMTGMVQSLEKLICYAINREEISAQDVMTMCSPQLTDRIFEMVRSIGEKKVKKALELYYDLLALKNTPFQILYMINRQFSQLLTLKDLSGKGMPPSLIAERLKQKEFIVKQNLNLTRQFTRQELEQALRDGIATEQEAKSGKLDAQLGVELLIVTYASTEDKSRDE